MHQDPLSSTVHEEFVRVIDEAAGLKDSVPGEKLASPRTPKRTSGDAEFDLGAAVFCATTDHSSAKKSRPTDTKAPDKSGRRTARKQLILPQDTPQTPQVEPKEQTESDCPSPKNKESSKVIRTGVRSKALSQDELSNLKARLQGIKKQAESLNRNGSVRSSVPEPETQLSIKPAPLPDPASAPSASQHEELKKTIGRAKELALKAQKKERGEQVGQASGDSE